MACTVTRPLRVRHGRERRWPTETRATARPRSASDHPAAAAGCTITQKGIMSELDNIAQKVLAALEAKNAAREHALTQSRKVIQQSALTISASHRADFEEAARLLAAARDAAREMREGARVHPDLYYAGYVQDA